jgi:protein-disulfide isomerase-like protein with CxxC motif
MIDPTILKLATMAIYGGISIQLELLRRAFKENKQKTDAHLAQNDQRLDRIEGAVFPALVTKR